MMNWKGRGSFLTGDQGLKQVVNHLVTTSCVLEVVTGRDELLQSEHIEIKILDQCGSTADVPSCPVHPWECGMSLDRGSARGEYTGEVNE